MKIEAVSGGVQLRYEGSEGLDDRAVCVHRIGEGATEREDLGRRGCRRRGGLPVQLMGGEERFVEIREKDA